VRGQHLLDRAKRLALKLARNRVCPRRIRIDHPHQSHAARLLQLPIDASMVAPKSAHTNHRNINRKFRAQMSAPERSSNALLSQLTPQIGKRKTIRIVIPTLSS
jgi:hypothetical protein